MDTDPARRVDLISEIYACVWEETPLREVKNQVTDLLGEERAVVHGPWTAAEVQSVLIPWLAAGWIELIVDAGPPWEPGSAAWHARASKSGAFLVLAAKDAADLLQDPTRWVGAVDGQVMLSRTGDGESRDYAEWVALASHE